MTNAKTSRVWVILAAGAALGIAGYFLAARNTHPSTETAKIPDTVHAVAEQSDVASRGTEPKLTEPETMLSQEGTEATKGEIVRKVELAKLGARAGGPAQDIPTTPAKVAVWIGNRPYNLVANPSGGFDIVFMEKPEDVRVSVSYPGAVVGEAVHAEILDGGRFTDQKEIGRKLEIGADRAVSFGFRPTGERGKFRIRLQKGEAINVVEFWMGAPPIMHGASLAGTK